MIAQTTPHAQPVKRRFLILTTALSLTLGACAPTIWTKSDFDEAMWRRDAYECERDSRMSVLSFGGGIMAAVEARKFQARCLESKGYYRMAQ